MHDDVICSKFTTKSCLRELLITLCHPIAVFTRAFFSFLLLWEVVQTSFLYERLCTKTRLETDENSNFLNLEMAYLDNVSRLSAFCFVAAIHFDF